jgi:2-hydroxychromene-2-carboxylate isomerase
MMTPVTTVNELERAANQFTHVVVSVLIQQQQRIEKMEAIIEAAKNAPLDDAILNVREAAEMLRMQPASVRKARINGRLKGIKINEKEWGFRKSEIDRYLQRYNRPQ